MRRAGFSHRRLREESGVLFVVRSLKIEYLRPARLDDLLLIETRPSGRGRVYADFLQTARRAENGEKTDNGGNARGVHFRVFVARRVNAAAAC